MNPSPQPSRTELIQRLADGELSELERKEPLQKIDDETPERWRDVALCLLGNRHISEGLRNPAPTTVATAPATNVIAFPVWQRIGALAAVLALGLGVGLSVPRPRDAGGNGAVFANVDEFKKAVGEAMQESEVAGGLQDMLAVNLVGGGGGGSQPTADAPTKLPRPSLGGHRPVPSVGGAAKEQGIESKVNQIQKNVADIRRLLEAMQPERK